MAKGEIRVVSGMRTTGRLHLGHYFGVLTNYLELQKKYDCLFMAADLHAMTTGDLSQKIWETNTRELILDWLSVGIDPNRAILFIQSAIPEHSELYVLLSMLTSLGWLERNPTYKEQREQLGEKWTSSLGFLGYPVLQTVDVCIYKGTHVPVGEDQKPHLEMGRELIRRFNKTFGSEYFPEYQAMLTTVPKLSGTDGRKMSKSYGNVIELSEEPKSLKEKVLKMMTDTARKRLKDPGNPENCPAFGYHKLFTPEKRQQELDKMCRSATISCADCKGDLASRMLEWQAPILEKRRSLEANPKAVDDIIAKGNAQARQRASSTMEEVKKIVGLHWQGQK